jgi:hypothetical protein
VVPRVHGGRSALIANERNFNAIKPCAYALPCLQQVAASCRAKNAFRDGGIKEFEAVRKRGALDQEIFSELAESARLWPKSTVF